MTYSDFFKPPTEAETRKRIAIVNVLREREACAIIADAMALSIDAIVTDDLVSQVTRTVIKATAEKIAAKIRAQSAEFKTMDEVLTEEAAIATGAARILMEGFER